MFTLLYLLALVWYAIVTDRSFDEGLFALSIIIMIIDYFLIRMLLIAFAGLAPVAW